MDTLTKLDLHRLLTKSGAPCVSLLMPTHPGGGEQDRTRWKKLLSQTQEQLLRRGLGGSETKALLRQARNMLEDSIFWKNQAQGLAYFLSPQLNRVYRLPRSIAEAVIVGDHFQVKSLFPFLTDNGQFFVLAISQKNVRLFQGNSAGLQEVELHNVPHSLAEAMRFHDTDEPLLYHTQQAGGTGSWVAVFHGHGVGIDDAKDDFLRYFQQINKGLHDLLQNEKAPLLLASVAYLWPIYREANTYSHLLQEGIAGNPDQSSSQELHRKARDIVQPRIAQPQKRAAALYRRLAGTGRTSASPDVIVRSAYHGQLELLFVSLDDRCWGLWDTASAKAAIHTELQPGDEDLCNLAAIHTFLHGGTVYAVPQEEMPAETPAAGIFWLPERRRK